MIHTIDFTDPPPAGRHECDQCGDWHVELRLQQGNGWTIDTYVCGECFRQHDGENSFTDLALIQGATQ